MILQTLINGDFISLTVESFQFHLSLSFQIQEETETFRTFDVALRHGWKLSLRHAKKFSGLSTARGEN